MERIETERLDERLCSTTSNKLQVYIQSLAFFDDSLEDYFYIYDLKSERVYFTDKIRERFPLPPAGADGNAFSDWNEIVYPKDREFMDYYRNLLIEGKIESFSIAYRIFDREKNKVWVNVKGVLREDEDKQLTLLVGRITETEFGRVVDSLTGLRSVEKFTEDLPQNLKMTDGYLMILDVDNFKHINITQGRHTGDDILKRVADVLDQFSLYPLKLYRLDGDRFAVIFPDKSKNDVIDFYQAVKKELKTVCTLSAGVVFFNCNDVIDSGEVHQYAENALDQAKREGKDRMFFFSADNYQRNLEQIELLDELREAVEENCRGFYLLYQPQINSADYSLYGVEALLRFHSPERGQISPVEFIPLLEKSGLICPVGEWVLKTAIAQCKEWRKQIPDFHMSVNVSYVQLQQPGIAELVLDLVEDAELPGEALILELTESMHLQNYHYFNRIFAKWKQESISVAIDDFGTGYSSLSYLKTLEIDKVKIDRCFVDHIQQNAYNYRLLSNMIELSHSANIGVCCEGVETTEELLALQELHTDLLQGYLFAKPCSVDEIEQIYLHADSKAYQSRVAKESKIRQSMVNGRTPFLTELRNEEIGNIVDGMEEVVYVSDVDTYELCYLNTAGKRMTGVYNYKGCKCYEVLQGRDKPCEFCTNKQLSEDKFYVWESENQYLGRRLILKDKLIPWQGRIARLEIGIDITRREIVSQSVQRKLKFERAIVDSCKVLASKADQGKIVADVLQIMGEFCQADRAYVLRPSTENNIWKLSWEWCAEGVDSLKCLYPVPLEQINSGNYADSIIVPIVRENRLIGFIGVDNSGYAEDAKKLIGTMSYFFSYTMIGEETQRRLNTLLERRYEDIRDHTDLGLWVMRVDVQTRECELYPDEVLCRIMGLKKNQSPKDTFMQWYTGIDGQHREYVNGVLKDMIYTERITQLEYPWNDTDKGEVLMHSVGVRREAHDDIVCVEGYLWVIS